jgi:hypothetical protein
MKKIKKQINNWYQWTIKNYSKILVIIVIHIVLTFLLQLPYINLVRIIISFLPYLVDWILILVLFKPSKNNILKWAFYLLFVGFFLNILKLQSILEVIGLAVYLFIATYILISLKEIRTKKHD